MAESSRRPTALVVTGFVVLGGIVATVLGLLTFGVQATVAPHDLPVAVGSATEQAAAPLSPVFDKITAQGGDELEWTVVSSEAEATALLDDKEVYAALLLSPAPGATPAKPELTATVLVSGGINPAGSQVAQQILSQAGSALASTVEVKVVHEASAAGRALPVSSSAILWLGTLVASVLGAVMLPRLTGRTLGVVGRLGVAVGAAVVSTAVVFGFAELWDSLLPTSWSLAWFLLLAGFAFATLQAAVLRLLGIRGLAVLGPLYLIAPAVAGQVPELLHPAYEAGLWSWSPFRFSTEGVRSLLYIGSDAPDVGTGILVFTVIVAVSLIVLLWPRGASQDATDRAGEPTGAPAPTRTPVSA